MNPIQSQISKQAAAANYVNEYEAKARAAGQIYGASNGLNGSQECNPVRSSQIEGAMDYLHATLRDCASEMDALISRLATVTSPLPTFEKQIHDAPTSCSLEQSIVDATMNVRTLLNAIASVRSNLCV